MHDKTELCERIRSLYPEIGACGIDIVTEWDEEKKGVGRGPQEGCP